VIGCAGNTVEQRLNLKEIESLNERIKLLDRYHSFVGLPSVPMSFYF